MPLVNVVKKIEKAADTLGLQPGEQVLAACTTNPKGTVKRMAFVQGGGLVGAAIAAATDKGESTEETVANAAGKLAARYPGGQLFLVVTDRRVLAAKVGAMSGKPKELSAEWTRAEVAGIEVEQGKLAPPMTITFSDGSAVVCEGAKGTNPGSLGEVLV